MNLPKKVLLIVMNEKQKDIIQKLTCFFSKKEEILAAYLFGSQARNAATPLSDIDVAILVDPPGLETDIYYHMMITADLLTVLHTNRVDVVILNRAPPLLAHRIIKYGIVVANKNDRERIRFEVNALRRYFDTRHLRDIQHIYVKKRLAG